MFKIRLGLPDVDALWRTLRAKADRKELSSDESKLYKQLGKAMARLAENPRHPGLNSHEIAALTRRYGQKVWQSYLENQTSAAWRIFWVYGPNQGEITVIGVEPHPEDRKRGGYAKIKLSDTSQ